MSLCQLLDKTAWVGEFVPVLTGSFIPGSIRAMLSVLHLKWCFIKGITELKDAQNILRVARREGDLGGTLKGGRD